MLRRATRLVAKLLLWVFVAVAVLWGMLALWIDGPSSRAVAGMAAVGLGAVTVFLAASIRPSSRKLIAVISPTVLVAIWWVSIPPSNNRDWAPEVARNATATYDGDRVTISNVRDFKYSSEFNYEQRWETRTYDIDRIRGLYLFLSFWGPTRIAHTIVSWEFDDGQHLAISIETRKEKGESYSALRGFFRRYELYYVVADERDVVRLRTNFRGEQVYLYRIRSDAWEARALLLDYLERINRLAEYPEWYNALTENCTTTIRGHAQNIGVAERFDWRLLLNGQLDELLYERGQTDTNLSFADLRARSNITEKAKSADDSDNFSARIRQGLPSIS